MTAGRAEERCADDRIAASAHRTGDLELHRFRSCRRQRNLLGAAIDVHGDADKAVARLAPVPAIGIALHCGVDLLSKSRKGRALGVLYLHLSPPFVRISRMTAEGAKDLFVAHLLSPVLLINFELEQTFTRRAFAVEVAF